MEPKLIEKFGELQDMALGFSDAREMTPEKFAEKYPTEGALLAEMRYCLSIYDEEGTATGEMKYDSDPKVRAKYHSEKARLERFIAKLENITKKGEM